MLIGASSVGQLEQNVTALDNLEFTAEEIATIDRYAVDGGMICGVPRPQLEQQR